VPRSPLGAVGPYCWSTVGGVRAVAKAGAGLGQGPGPARPVPGGKGRAQSTDMTTILKLDAEMDWEGCAYVGRPMRQVPHWVLGADGRFGNPFRPENSTDKERARVILAFGNWLASGDVRAVKMADDAAAQLAGKALVCWCAPKRCHAEVLAVVADGGSVEEARLRAAQIADELDPPGLFDWAGLS